MTLLAPGARLVDAETGTVLDGSALITEVERRADRLAVLPDGVLFARTGVDVTSVLRYLAAVHAFRAVALIDPGLDVPVLEMLIERYRPAAVLDAPVTGPPAGYRAEDGHWLRLDEDGIRPHPDLAVVLPTSGSTGNPKLVRLSRKAILTNAHAISDVLGIDEREVAPTTLPLHYAYGLSVLNSHLVSGATVVVEREGILGRGFWDAVAAHECTTVAGVPYHYEMLSKLDFDPSANPGVHTLTQAGGRMRPELIAEFDTKMRTAGGRLFVMYGQTEAAPRMAVMPAERLAEKLGSVGPALPGGRFAVRRPDGTDTTHPKISGEIVYRGPNVMMGYAENAAQLALGDECGGVLPTGDLGYLDEEGFLFVTGRFKRIGKVFGNRISLDDLEHATRATGLGIDIVAAVAGDDKVVLFAEGVPAETCRAASRALSDRLHLHASGFDVRSIDTIPLLASGKIDYQALTDQI
ncbi:AMP-binding protein [Amycolatopsis endophytica]|uniref:Acyl-CoA synthetase (AMP-forming)/AMP-acid ligase II n=1 Tax=Amycolatopsis endophytica TaxID=860233 RepID=A0A853B0I7_9PSEU|nr:AMP-binding protein [Amycolatopsis endophytica]NYI88236.1 acyl-CoA synthetase (AMP-forming)/AMP-acid ligase II [Amycolatopsis endophytica]